MQTLPTLISFRHAAAAFCEGTITPRDYLEEAISNIAAQEEQVKAFAYLDLEHARKQADAATARYKLGRPLSPLDGMPIGVKDIIATSWMPTEMGSDIFTGWRPENDAACVDRIKQGGGVIVGKTATTEFAIGNATVTTNPHDIGHTPGGSSSGSAASVASGMVCAAIGTQTQGSIVRPASFCGVVGFKPSWGTFSMEGVHPVSPTHDHLGVFAPDLDVVCRVVMWLAGCNPGSSEAHLAASNDSCVVRRLAVIQTEGFRELSPQALDSFEAQLEEWSRRGIAIQRRERDADLNSFCEALNMVPEQSLDLVAYELQTPYLAYRQTHASALSGRIKELLTRGELLAGNRIESIRQVRQRLILHAKRLGERFDAFVLPAASGSAPFGLASTGSRTLQVYASFLGLPACNLPLQSVNSMPFGIQLVGLPKGDLRLLKQAEDLMGTPQTREQ